MFKMPTTAQINPFGKSDEKSKINVRNCPGCFMHYINGFLKSGLRQGYDKNGNSLQGIRLCLRKSGLRPLK